MVLRTVLVMDYSLNQEIIEQEMTMEILELLLRAFVVYYQRNGICCLLRALKWL